ncbi:MAG TPA: AraC family transcriptional regulator [Gallionella sp.]|nr:AraC family transcriptional regulator [Gallionella sp.]
MDGLENLLPGLRVKKAAYTCVEGHAPWGLDLDAYLHTKFGIVTEGCCHIDIKDGAAPVKLEKGGCYLLPRGNAFRIRDTAEGRTEKFEEAIARLEGRTLRCGKNGERTTVLGGRFIFADERYPLVLDLLPPLICFKVNDAELAALQATLHLLEKEVTAPSLGARAMLDSLANIFFVQTLRTYLLGKRERDTGWAGLLADERLGKAIRLMHGESHKPWTLASLAAQIGMSRSALAAHFRNKLGISPIAYLTRHRIQQAKALLLQPSPPGIARIAARVGYESEAAFNKAFKRELGLPPSAWRAQQRQS